MNDWASRRKNVYIGGVVLVLSTITFLIFWNYWYKAPTCNDGQKNGDETGLDCGGSCVLICRADTIRPVILWDPRLFEVLPGTWSALVYVDNLNINVDASYLPYSFKIYGEGSEILFERNSSTILPKNKTVGIFEGSINIKSGKKPKRAIFEIGKDIVWTKNDKPEPDLIVTHTPLLRQDSTPRVEANVKNNSADEINNIELVISIFDGKDNAIAASRTFVKNLKKNENANIFFTWPKPFELGSKVCERPSDTVLIIDRSGSMSSELNNPPEPLTSAKDAAIFFSKQLGIKDKVGLVSFATKSKEPIDLTLSSDLGDVEQAISSVAIESGSTQYTNIFEAIHSAWQELISSRVGVTSSKVMVLLTDGVANSPQNPMHGTEQDDIKYAESLALIESENAKKDGILIYSIGLGQNINETFLKKISSGDNFYFYAPSGDKLKEVYKNISSRVCKEVPARIEITYKIFGDSF